MEFFPQLGTCGVYDLNDAGTFCGWSTVKISRTSYAKLPFRYTTGLQTLSGGYDTELAWEINASGDVVTSFDRLYSDLWGFRTVTSLINPADPNLAAWNSCSQLMTTHVNNRDATTKCGQIGGVIWWADGTEKFYVLTPLSP